MVYWEWGLEVGTVLFLFCFGEGLCQRPSYLSSNIVRIDLNLCKPSRPTD